MATTLDAAPTTDADEVTPLLASSGTSESVTAIDEDDRPLPKLQILLLCYAYLGEGAAFIYIFPFINQLLVEMVDIPETDVGFWSGLIESLYSLTQMLLMIMWGKLSDRYGRKPVLIICSAGVAVSLSLFGFSTHLWQLMVFRSLAGVFAGSLVIVRTMISENSTSKTQAQAFGFFQFAGNLGLTVGSLLGGSFAKPAQQYPSIFGHVYLFVKFPYLLPCLVCAGIPATACILTFFFVHETRPVNKDGSPLNMEPPSIRSILAAPGVLHVLIIYEIGWFIGNAYTSVSPVYLFTPVDLGGLGLSPSGISLWMATTGVSQALWLLVIFAPLQHRIGTGNMLRYCGWAREIVLALYASLNIMLRANQTTLFWIMAPFCVVGATGVTMIYTGVQLALNDICPSPLALGTLNGLALSLAFGFRATVPAAFGSLFAIGVKYQIFWGYLVWVVLIALGLGFLYSLKGFPKQADGRHHPPPTVDLES